jgi:hypothetical protein
MLTYADEESAIRLFRPLVRSYLKANSNLTSKANATVTPEDFLAAAMALLTGEGAGHTSAYAPARTHTLTYAGIR